MTEHTYFRADDGTLFIPETMPTDVEVRFSTNNSTAFKECQEYEQQNSR
jgi:hypothetical protein